MPYRSMDPVIESIFDWAASVDSWAAENSLPISISPALEWLIGEWPRTDESKMAELAKAWLDKAEEYGEAAKDAKQLTQSAADSALMSGMARNTMVQSMADVQVALQALQDAATTRGTAVAEFAREISYAKGMIRINLALMVGELIAALISAVFTAGGGLASIPGIIQGAFTAIQALTRAVLAAISRIACKYSLKKLGEYSFKQAALGVGRNALQGSMNLLSSALGLAQRGARHVHPSRVAARNAAPQLQQQLRRQAKKALSGTGRAATLKTLRDPATRKAINRQLAERLAGKAAPNTGRLANMSPTERIIAEAVEEAVGKGLSTRSILGQRLLGYGVMSGLKFGALSDIGAQVMASWDAHGFTWQGDGYAGGYEQLQYSPEVKSTFKAISGGVISGAPMAFASKTPGYMATGALGGAGAYAFDTGLEALTNPNADFAASWRLGGVDSLLDAVGGGAIGGAWERHIGDVGLAGMKSSFDELKLDLNIRHIERSTDIAHQFGVDAPVTDTNDLSEAAGIAGAASTASPVAAVGSATAASSSTSASAGAGQSSGPSPDRAGTNAGNTSAKRAEASQETGRSPDIEQTVADDRTDAGVAENTEYDEAVPAASDSSDSTIEGSKSVDTTVDRSPVLNSPGTKSVPGNDGGSDSGTPSADHETSDSSQSDNDSRSTTSDSGGEPTSSKEESRVTDDSTGEHSGSGQAGRSPGEGAVPATEATHEGSSHSELSIDDTTEHRDVIRDEPQASQETVVEHRSPEEATGEAEAAAPAKADDDVTDSASRATGDDDRPDSSVRPGSDAEHEGEAGDAGGTESGGGHDASSDAEHSEQTRLRVGDIVSPDPVRAEERVFPDYDMIGWPSNAQEHIIRERIISKGQADSNSSWPSPVPEEPQRFPKGWTAEDAERAGLAVAQKAATDPEAVTHCWDGDSWLVSAEHDPGAGTGSLWTVVRVSLQGEILDVQPGRLASQAEDAEYKRQALTGALRKLYQEGLLELNDDGTVTIAELPQLSGEMQVQFKLDPNHDAPDWVVEPPSVTLNPDGYRADGPATITLSTRFAANYSQIGPATESQLLEAFQALQRTVPGGPNTRTSDGETGEVWQAAPWATSIRSPDPSVSQQAEHVEHAEQSDVEQGAEQTEAEQAGHAEISFAGDDAVLPKSADTQQITSKSPDQLLVDEIRRFQTGEITWSQHDDELPVVAITGDPAPGGLLLITYGDGSTSLVRIQVEHIEATEPHSVVRPGPWQRTDSGWVPVPKKPDAILLRVTGDHAQQQEQVTRMLSEELPCLHSTQPRQGAVGYSSSGLHKLAKQEPATGPKIIPENSDNVPDAERIRRVKWTAQQLRSLLKQRLATARTLPDAETVEVLDDRSSASTHPPIQFTFDSGASIDAVVMVDPKLQHNYQVELPGVRLVDGVPRVLSPAVVKIAPHEQHDPEHDHRDPDDTLESAIGELRSMAETVPALDDATSRLQLDPATSALHKSLRQADPEILLLEDAPDQLDISQTRHLMIRIPSSEGTDSSATFANRVQRILDCLIEAGFRPDGDPHIDPRGRGYVSTWRHPDQEHTYSLRIVPPESAGLRSLLHRSGITPDNAVWDSYFAVIRSPSSVEGVRIKSSAELSFERYQGAVNTQTIVGTTASELETVTGNRSDGATLGGGADARERLTDVDVAAAWKSLENNADGIWTDKLRQYGITGISRKPGTNRYIVRFDSGAMVEVLSGVARKPLGSNDLLLQIPEINWLQDGLGRALNAVLIGFNPEFSQEPEKLVGKLLQGLEMVHERLTVTHRDEQPGDGQDDGSTGRNDPPQPLGGGDHDSGSNGPEGNRGEPVELGQADLSNAMAAADPPLIEELAEFVYEQLPKPVRDVGEFVSEQILVELKQQVRESLHRVMSPAGHTFVFSGVEISVGLSGSGKDGAFTGRSRPASEYPFYPSRMIDVQQAQHDQRRSTTRGPSTTDKTNVKPLEILGLFVPADHSDAFKSADAATGLSVEWETSGNSQWRSSIVQSEREGLARESWGQTTRVQLPVGGQPGEATWWAEINSTDYRTGRKDLVVNDGAQHVLDLWVPSSQLTSAPALERFQEGVLDVPELNRSSFLHGMPINKLVDDIVERLPEHTRRPGSLVRAQLWRELTSHEIQLSEPFRFTLYDDKGITYDIRIERRVDWQKLARDGVPIHDTESGIFTGSWWSTFITDTASERSSEARGLGLGTNFFKTGAGFGGARAGETSWATEFSSGNFSMGENLGTSPRLTYKVDAALDITISPSPSDSSAPDADTHKKKHFSRKANGLIDIPAWIAGNNGLAVPAHQFVRDENNEIVTYQVRDLDSGKNRNGEDDTVVREPDGSLPTVTRTLPEQNDAPRKRDIDGESVSDPDAGWKGVPQITQGVSEITGLYAVRERALELFAEKGIKPGHPAYNDVRRQLEQKLVRKRWRSPFRIAQAVQDGVRFYIKLPHGKHAKIVIRMFEHPGSSRVVEQSKTAMLTGMGLDADSTGHQTGLGKHSRFDLSPGFFIPGAVGSDGTETPSVGRNRQQYVGTRAAHLGSVDERQTAFDFLVELHMFGPPVHSKVTGQLLRLTTPRDEEVPDSPRMISDRDLGGKHPNFVRQLLEEVLPNSAWLRLGVGMEDDGKGLHDSVVDAFTGQDIVDPTAWVSVDTQTDVGTLLTNLPNLLDPGGHHAGGTTIEKAARLRFTAIDQVGYTGLRVHEPGQWGEQVGSVEVGFNDVPVTDTHHVQGDGRVDLYSVLGGEGNIQAEGSVTTSTSTGPIQFHIHTGDAVRLLFVGQLEQVHPDGSVVTRDARLEVLVPASKILKLYGDGLLPEGLVPDAVIGRLLRLWGEDRQRELGTHPGPEDVHGRPPWRLSRDNIADAMYRYVVKQLEDGAPADVGQLQLVADLYNGEITPPDHVVSSESWRTLRDDLATLDSLAEISDTVVIQQLRELAELRAFYEGPTKTLRTATAPEYLTQTGGIGAGIFEGFRSQQGQSPYEQAKALIRQVAPDALDSFPAFNKELRDRLGSSSALRLSLRSALRPGGKTLVRHEVNIDGKRRWLRVSMEAKPAGAPHPSGWGPHIEVHHRSIDTSKSDTTVGVGSTTSLSGSTGQLESAGESGDVSEDASSDMMGPFVGGTETASGSRGAVSSSLAAKTRTDGLLGWHHTVEFDQHVDLVLTVIVEGPGVSSGRHPISRILPGTLKILFPQPDTEPGHRPGHPDFRSMDWDPSWSVVISQVDSRPVERALRTVLDKMVSRGLIRSAHRDDLDHAVESVAEPGNLIAQWGDLMAGKPAQFTLETPGRRPVVVELRPEHFYALRLGRSALDDEWKSGIVRSDRSESGTGMDSYVSSAFAQDGSVGIGNDPVPLFGTERSKTINRITRAGEHRGHRRTRTVEQLPSSGSIANPALSTGFEVVAWVRDGTSLLVTGQKKPRSVRVHDTTSVYFRTWAEDVDAMVRALERNMAWQAPEPGLLEQVWRGIRSRERVARRFPVDLGSLLTKNDSEPLHQRLANYVHRHRLVGVRPGALIGFTTDPVVEAADHHLKILAQMQDLRDGLEAEHADLPADHASHQNAGKALQRAESALRAANASRDGLERLKESRAALAKARRSNDPAAERVAEEKLDAALTSLETLAQYVREGGAELSEAARHVDRIAAEIQDDARESWSVRAYELQLDPSWLDVDRVGAALGAVVDLSRDTQRAAVEGLVQEIQPDGTVREVRVTGNGLVREGSGEPELFRPHTSERLDPETAREHVFEQVQKYFSRLWGRSVAALRPEPWPDQRVWEVSSGDSVVPVHVHIEPGAAKPEAYLPATSPGREPDKVIVRLPEDVGRERLSSIVQEIPQLITQIAGTPGESQLPASDPHHPSTHDRPQEAVPTDSSVHAALVARPDLADMVGQRYPQLAKSLRRPVDVDRLVSVDGSGVDVRRLYQEFGEQWLPLVLRVAEAHDLERVEWLRRQAWDGVQIDLAMVNLRFTDETLPTQSVPDRTGLMRLFGFDPDDGVEIRRFDEMMAQAGWTRELSFTDRLLLREVAGELGVWHGRWTSSSRRALLEEDSWILRAARQGRPAGLRSADVVLGAPYEHTVRALHGVRQLTDPERAALESITHTVIREFYSGGDSQRVVPPGIFDEVLAAINSEGTQYGAWVAARMPGAVVTDELTAERIVTLTGDPNGGISAGQRDYLNRYSRSAHWVMPGDHGVQAFARAIRQVLPDLPAEDDVMARFGEVAPADLPAAVADHMGIRIIIVDADGYELSIGHGTPVTLLRVAAANDTPEHYLPVVSTESALLVASGDPYRIPPPVIVESAGPRSVSDEPDALVPVPVHTEPSPAVRRAVWSGVDVADASAQAHQANRAVSAVLREQAETAEARRAEYLGGFRAALLDLLSGQGLSEFLTYEHDLDLFQTYVRDGCSGLRSALERTSRSGTTERDFFTRIVGMFGFDPESPADVEMFHQFLEQAGMPRQPSPGELAMLEKLAITLAAQDNLWGAEQRRNVVTHDLDAAVHLLRSIPMDADPLYWVPGMGHVGSEAMAAEFSEIPSADRYGLLATVRRLTGTIIMGAPVEHAEDFVRLPGPVEQALVVATHRYGARYTAAMLTGFSRSPQPEVLLGRDLVIQSADPNTPSAEQQWYATRRAMYARWIRPGEGSFIRAVEHAWRGRVAAPVPAHLGETLDGIPASEGPQTVADAFDVRVSVVDQSGNVQNLGNPSRPELVLLRSGDHYMPLVNSTPPTTPTLGEAVPADPAPESDSAAWSGAPSSSAPANTDARPDAGFPEVATAVGTEHEQGIPGPDHSPDSSAEVLDHSPTFSTGLRELGQSEIDHLAEAVRDYIGDAELPVTSVRERHAIRFAPRPGGHTFEIVVNTGDEARIAVHVGDDLVRIVLDRVPDPGVETTLILNPPLRRALELADKSS